MSDFTVVITGANGFIGTNLVRHFRSKSWKVRALVRRFPAESLNGVEYVRYDISEPPVDSAFRGAQFLVHCAYVKYDGTPNSDAVNIEGARRLAALCRHHGIKAIFLSSFSAHEEAESHYGKSKYQIESLFDPSRDLVLRPGLVVGAGGLFGAMVKTIASHRLVPLVGAGDQPLQTIAVADLCLIVERGLKLNICGIYKVADPASITLREMCRLIAERQARSVRFVPVPTRLILFCCRVAEALHIGISLSSDSILGLECLRKYDTANDLRVFGIAIKPFREILKSSLPLDS